MSALARVSISEITTLPLTFDQDIELYAQAGVGGIGVWEMKLGGRSRREAAALVRDYGLRVTNLVAMGNSVFPTAMSPKPALVVTTGVADGLPVGEVHARCVSGLRRLARHAAHYGMQVALEPIHASAAPDFSVVSTVRSAAELAAEVDEPNVCLLYDTWHMGQEANAPAVIGRYGSLIGAVHVADVHEPTRSWADRSFPGEGSLPLKEIIDALESVGYEGSYDVEIFSDDGTFAQRFPDSLWLLPAEECVARAVAWLADELGQASDPAAKG